VPYIVQAGENLYRIALRYGTTYPKLQEANCLMTDAIYVGQQLYLPPVTPNLPAPTPLGATPGLRTMSDTSAQEGSACIDENSRITSPAPEQAVSGTFQIYGTATVENFDFYKLEIRPDGRSAYATVEQYDTPVINGLLGEINTAAFGPGQYWVRLVVVDITGNYPHTPCAIRLDFE
jgi:LysM repeat protein